MGHDICRQIAGKNIIINHTEKYGKGSNTYMMSGAINQTLYILDSNSTKCDIWTISTSVLCEIVKSNDNFILILNDNANNELRVLTLEDIENEIIDIKRYYTNKEETTIIMDRKELKDKYMVDKQSFIRTIKSFN